MTARRIVIEFLGKDKSLGSTAADVDHKTSKLGGTLKSVGLLAGGALAAGAILAGKALFGMAKNAAEDEAGQRKLAKALQNTAGATDVQIAAVESYISKTSVAKNITDDELRPAFQRLVQATGDIGKAQVLMTTAMDASVGSGKSLKVVTEAISKAQNGNLGALSKLGVKIKDVHGETLGFDQVMQGMSKTFKGQADEAANSFEGKMGRLKIVFDETKESIGAKLLPILTNLATWFLDKGLPAIQAFGSWLGDTLGPIFSHIGAVVSSVLGGMQGDVGGNLSTIRSIIKDFVTVIRVLWKQFGADIIKGLKTAFETVRAVLKGVLLIIGGILKVFSGLLTGNWAKAWDGVKMILRGAVTAIVAVIKGLASNALTIIANLGGLLLKGIVALPGLIVKGAAHLFRAAGRALMDAMIEGLKNAAGIITGIASSVWDAIKGLLNPAIDKINSALDFKIDLPGPDIHVNIPDIPHLARGGVVRARRGGVLALLGEGGHDEAVVPLSGPHATRDDRPILLQVLLDGKVIEQALIKRTRDTGRPLAIRVAT
jgi:phage-related protein